jgi:putative hemolysin
MKPTGRRRREGGEIRLMVEIGRKRLSIESTERDMMRTYRIQNTTVDEVMRTRWISRGATGRPGGEILETIRESGLSRFPVYDEDLNESSAFEHARIFAVPESPQS